MRYTIFFFLSILLCACKMQSADLREQAKKDIADAEKAFEKMVAEKGIAEGFWYFADSNAIMKRGDDSLINGREGIKHFYARPYFKTATVSWSPDFVDASVDGTMGYTYGKYIWTSKDSTGKTHESKGVFHTVWKKQKDEGWKYVWD